MPSVHGMEGEYPAAASTYEEAPAAFVYHSHSRMAWGLGTIPAVSRMTGYGYIILVPSATCCGNPSQSISMAGIRLRMVVET